MATRAESVPFFYLHFASMILDARCTDGDGLGFMVQLEDYTSLNSFCHDFLRLQPWISVSGPLSRSRRRSGFRV